MKTTIITITLKNGTRMSGPSLAALAWMEQQVGYRPVEILPAKVEICSSVQTEEQAHKACMCFPARTHWGLGPEPEREHAKRNINHSPQKPRSWSNCPMGSDERTGFPGQNVGTFPLIDNLQTKPDVSANGAWVAASVKHGQVTDYHFANESL